MKTEVNIGIVVVTPLGTLVGATDFWHQYESQNFIRSTDDGITWTQATQTTAMDNRHSIIHMTTGYTSSCE